jgi:hypothetical protein
VGYKFFVRLCVQYILYIICMQFHQGTAYKI